MDSSQKRERDRKQRQRRQDKEARRKERAEQKILRRTTPTLEPSTPSGEAAPGMQADSAPAADGQPL